MRNPLCYAGWLRSVHTPRSGCKGNCVGVQTRKGLCFRSPWFWCSYEVCRTYTFCALQAHHFGPHEEVEEQCVRLKHTGHFDDEFDLAGSVPVYLSKSSSANSLDKLSMPEPGEGFGILNAIPDVKPLAV